MSVCATATVAANSAVIAPTQVTKVSAGDNPAAPDGSASSNG